jgi:LCP family protein required for cell wall assembly
MTRTTKPYRRYRARGGDGEDRDGLDDLRAMTAKASGVASPPGAPPGRGRDGVPAAPPPPPRAGRLERRQRRALRREGRHWYSFRGLGPGGWIGRIAILLLIGVFVWAGLGYMALNNAVGEANSKVTASARAARDTPSGGMLGTPENTLILGVDARKGKTRSRADTILIMRTDPDSGRIKYLSIPRDWRVDLPVYGTQKINAAFFFFGQAGMIRAVKQLTGLPINHIMVIKFNGFPKMVDAVGGVTVYNPTALVDCPYEAGQRVSFPKGRQSLDGQQALVFSRVRKCDSDLNRALRQQAVVAGMKSKVLSFTNLWRAPWQGAGVVREIGTDIGTTDMIKMGWLQARLKQHPEDRILLTGTPENIGGIDYVVQTDPDLNEREIARFVGPN